MRYRILLTMALSLMMLHVSAQSDQHVRQPYPDEASLGAVHVERVGSVLTIDYRILLGENVRSCNVRLLVSTDGGKSFTGIPSNDYVNGDVGIITASGYKSINYDVSRDKQWLADKPVVFKVDVTDKYVMKAECFILGSASVYPDMSYGISFGRVKKTGFYLKAVSNFNMPVSFSYECNNDGLMDNGVSVLTNGNARFSRFTVCGGIVMRLSNRFYTNVGVGYGTCQWYWQDIDDYWVRVSNQSVSGLSVDAGCMFRLKRLLLSAGVNNTAFKYTDAHVGIGFIF